LTITAERISAACDLTLPDRKRARPAVSPGNEMETTGCKQAKNVGLRTWRKRVIWPIQR
jgi:hypothetical protein